MKKIYLIFTYTGTFLARLIKFYTKEEYSHVSIALDQELKEMYSFGRLNPYNPLKAGFVHEELNTGTFKRFYNTKASIYSLPITTHDYYKILGTIHKFKKNKSKYKFNIGLIAVALNKKITYKKSLYCAEFVKYILDEANLSFNLPDLIKPMSFKKIPNLTLIYKGYLRDYYSN